LVALCEKAAAGCPDSRRLALELSEALTVLSTYDEGPDLVLYYKYLMVLEGHSEYTHHFNPTDALSASQKEFIRTQWQLFRTWWSQWPGAR
jgi:4-hydroxy-tetrahydrodipicolinate synthase